jgi:predicted dehydrogenase
MISKRNLVVIGWGRMGVTHTAIINGLYPKAFDFIIVEPNKIVSRITLKTLGYNIVSDLDEIVLADAIVLITTPPSVHSVLCENVLSRGARSVFVEKPFGLFDKRVNDDSRISAGYVLRFSEVVQKLKSLIQQEGCTKISLDYSSHTLTKPPKGWRNSEYGGVINEMGSHLIDLILYLGGGQEFKVLNSTIQSVISDVDDIVKVKGILGDMEVELSLNWVNPNYRKPVWSGFIETSKRTVRFDQQSVDGGFNVASVDYYVRGRDFSLQMKHFIENDKSIICNSKEANIVHDVITKIKEKV